MSLLIPGLVSITFRPLSPQELIKLVAEAGLKAIEWGGDIHVPHGDVSRAQEVGRQTTEAGLSVAAYGSYYRLGVSEAAGLAFEQVLDSAVEDASRMIRTGRAQAANYQMADFRTLMCGSTFNLFDCSQIQLSVKVITDFNIVSTPIQTCNTDPALGPLTCTWNALPPYDAGAKKEIVQVGAYYRYPLVIVLPYFNLKNQPDNYRLIGALRVFRNEPF